MNNYLVRIDSGGWGVRNFPMHIDAKTTLEAANKYLAECTMEELPIAPSVEVWTVAETFDIGIQLVPRDNTE